MDVLLVAARLRQLTIHHRKLLHSVRARLRKIAMECMDFRSSKVGIMDLKKQVEVVKCMHMPCILMHN